MLAQTTDSLPIGKCGTAAGPLVAVVFLAIAAINLYLLGWEIPAIVTRTESTSGVRGFVHEVFGNAPTVGRVFVGRVR